jgi:hypothetical protein
LTTVPTSLGFWTSWLPFSLPQRWPFCWWVAVAVDHYSRRLMGFAVFDQQPTSVAVRTFLGRAMGRPEPHPDISSLTRASSSATRRSGNGAVAAGFVSASVRLESTAASLLWSG